MPVVGCHAKSNEKVSWKGCVNMANDVILAIRKINDRAKGLVKNLGADNPITQQYLSRMETLVPDQYLREDKNGVLQISRSKDFEKMGYTAERDFNLNKFQGIQDLRKEYQRQFEMAKKEMESAGKEAPTKDEFIARQGELQSNIPVLYANQDDKRIMKAIGVLRRKGSKTYAELNRVARIIEDVKTQVGEKNAEDLSEGIGSHTITFD